MMLQHWACLIKLHGLVAAMLKKHSSSSPSQVMWDVSPRSLRQWNLSPVLRPLGQTVSACAGAADVGEPAIAGQPKWEIEVHKMYTASTVSKSKARLAQQECISRESNPGHIDGNDVFHH
jgi:hypothetical protein